MQYWTITVLAATVTFLAAESANSRPVGHHARAWDRTLNHSEFPINGGRWRAPGVYHPCPANVVFGRNRHACLGLPD